jgi:hypothetical protein
MFLILCLLLILLLLDTPVNFIVDETFRLLELDLRVPTHLLRGIRGLPFAYVSQVSLLVRVGTCRRPEPREVTRGLL